MHQPVLTAMKHVPPLLAVLLVSTCTVQASETMAADSQADGVSPASDPSNAGGWCLNGDISDEFDGVRLDASKWHIQGTDGFYRSHFIGRAPSQFSLDNVRVEDGKLKIATRWEPDYPFSDKMDDGAAYENITTAAVISKAQFLYGYMEIRCKAADASITSSFWATGGGAELDVFEFMGAPAQKHKKPLEKEYMFTVIDWTKPKASRRAWRDQVQLDWRMADDFHVYGCAWDQHGLTFYADGKQVGRATRKDLGEEWILTKPIWVWVDSETFPWHGLPEEGDLPVDFEIDYIRVWQKKEGAAPGEHECTVTDETEQ